MVNERTAHPATDPSTLMLGRVLALMTILAIALLAAFAASAAESAPVKAGYIVRQGGEVEYWSGTERFKATPSGFERVAEKAVGPTESAQFILYPSDKGEDFYLRTEFRSAAAVTAPITVRMAGAKVGTIQTGFGEFSGFVTPGGFSGISAGPLVIIGRKQVSLSGRYPSGERFVLRETVLSPQLDRIHACDVYGDDSILWVYYRLRGHRPEYPPFAEYGFMSGGFRGELRFVSVEGDSLPGPVWVAVEVNAADFDAHFAGTHDFLLKVPGWGWSSADWATSFWSRQELPPCSTQPSN